MGAEKWPIIRRPGQALVSAPQMSKVCASLKQGLTPSEHRGERARAGESQRTQSSFTALLCVLLLFFYSLAPASASLCCWICARRTKLCAQQLKSACVTRNSLRAREICAHADVFSTFDTNITRYEGSDGSMSCIHHKTCLRSYHCLTNRLIKCKTFWLIVLCLGETQRG